MPLNSQNQMQLLSDILSNHSTDCCGSVSECEQVERLVKSLMVNVDIHENVKPVLQEIIAALTVPLSSEDKRTGFINRPTPRLVEPDTADHLHNLFLENGWTDGLPIKPPTEEAVAEMLTGTDLPPDHLVGKLIPRLGKATVEKIAVNAVMSGALPTYMPLLITGLKILMEPSSNFGTWGVSTGSWAPFWVINGPIRNDIKVNIA